MHMRHLTDMQANCSFSTNMLVYWSNALEYRSVFKSILIKCLKYFLLANGLDFSIGPIVISTNVSIMLTRPFMLDGFSDFEECKRISVFLSCWILAKVKRIRFGSPAFCSKQESLYTWGPRPGSENAEL